MPSFAAILDDAIGRRAAGVPDFGDGKGETAWQQVTHAWRVAEIEEQRVPPCFRALGMAEIGDLAAVKRAFRVRALQVHPDRGGDQAAFVALFRAYEEALDHLA